MEENGWTYEQPWDKDSSFMKQYYEIKLCGVLDECTRELSETDMAALARSLIHRLQALALKGEKEPTLNEIAKRMLDLVGEGKYDRTD